MNRMTSLKTLIICCYGDCSDRPVQLTETGVRQIRALAAALKRCLNNRTPRMLSATARRGILTAMSRAEDLDYHSIHRNDRLGSDDNAIRFDALAAYQWMESEVYKNLQTLIVVTEARPAWELMNLFWKEKGGQPLPAAHLAPGQAFLWSGGPVHAIPHPSIS